MLAAIGLVYGSLLAFRAPDIRGVIAYSSLAQMGLITLGLFAVNDLGFERRRAADGQPRADLGGAVPARRRRSSGARRPASSTALGGMARGRPALATVLMTTGVIALAVPGSAAFAGEFLDPRRRLPDRLGLGRRRRGRDRARRDVHAAADLGGAAPGARARRSRDAALDLRPAELGVLVPLVACLLVLSAWPAAITEPRVRRHDAGAARARSRRVEPPMIAVDRHADGRLVRGSRRSLDRCSAPHVDWFALLVAVLRRRAAAAVALLGAALVAAARASLGAPSRRRLRRSSLDAARPSPHGSDRRRRDPPRPLGALAALIVVAAGPARRRCVSYGERCRDEHVGEYYALLAAAGARDGLPRRRRAT